MTEIDIIHYVQCLIGAVDASAGAKERLKSLRIGLTRLPDAQESDENVRWREYEIRVTSNARLGPELEALSKIRGLDLSSAPEVVAVVPIGDNHSVAIKRYAACAGETLFPATNSRTPFRSSAASHFLTEMKALVANGLIHRYSRGIFHWLVSSETGTLLLENWATLTECEPEEGEELLRMIEANLEMRGTVDDSAAGTSVAATPSRIAEIFGASRVLLPVVHPVDEASAMTSVRVAVEATCKGIFLINQGMSSDEVLALVMRVRRDFPSLWVGVNLLGVPPAEVLRRGLAICEGRLDGIWTDNASIDEHASSQPEAQAFVDARRHLGWNGLYFGGVAFKYQRDVPASSLGQAAATAATFMDVVCTSGPGTGQAAEVDKVAAMRAGMPAAGSLALASGVTDANASGFLRYVDAYLVGTGIERDFGVLDPVKVARLQSIIDSYRPEGTTREL